jgi:hypothetical protein
MLPPTSFGWPSIVTLVPAAAPADVLASDDELADADELADDDSVDDLSPEEQPAKPATTIAAPPTATSKPCFTTVSPSSVRPFKINRPSRAV